MKIRAKVKGTGERVEGCLVCRDGDPYIFLLDNRNRQYVYGMYKETIEFFIKGKWRNLVEGLEIYIEHIGEGSIPRGLLLYYREKVQEGKTGVHRQ